MINILDPVQFSVFVLGLCAGWVAAVTIWLAAALLKKNFGTRRRPEGVSAPAATGAAPAVRTLMPEPAGAASVGPAQCAIPERLPAPAAAQSAVPVRRPSPAWVPTRDQAEALLLWLREAPELGCEIAAQEVSILYREMCDQKYWAIRPWTAIAVELRKLTGGDKTYAWRNGQRVRVYRIDRASNSRETRPRQMTQLPMAA